MWNADLKGGGGVQIVSVNSVGEMERMKKERGWENVEDLNLLLLQLCPSYIRRWCWTVSDKPKDRKGFRESSCSKMSKSKIRFWFYSTVFDPLDSRAALQPAGGQSCSAALRWSWGPEITADWSKSRCEINFAPVHHDCTKKLNYCQSDQIMMHQLRRGGADWMALIHWTSLISQCWASYCPSGATREACSTTRWRGRGFPADHFLSRQEGSWPESMQEVSLPVRVNTQNSELRTQTSWQLEGRDDGATRSLPVDC